MTAGVRRGLKIVAVLAVLWFAIEGGQYSTIDLIRLRRTHQALIVRVDHLQHEVDSLTVLTHALNNDPVTQERIAREEFGMVRGNELLYRFAAPKP